MKGQPLHSHGSLQYKLHVYSILKRKWLKIARDVKSRMLHVRSCYVPIHHEVYYLNVQTMHLFSEKTPLLIII